MQPKFRLLPKLTILLLIIAIGPLFALELGTQYRLQSERNRQELERTQTDTIDEMIRQQQIGFGITTVIAVVLSTITIILLRRSIVNPINKLQANAQRLLSGEFPAFDLPGAEDEIAKLADTLREMSTGLHALVIEAELHSKDVEKLYQEASRRATALETIRGVSQRISTILNIEDLLPEIVELIRSGFDYDRVHLLTVDHAAGELVFRAGAGRAGRVGAETGERIPINPESLLGQVASDGQPLIVQDFAREPRYRFSPPSKPTGYIPQPETRAELVVPLSVGKQIIGVLSVQSNTPEIFEDRDMFVLQELANQAAGAIINAQLYEEAFNHAEEIMALLITSVAVSTAPDLDVRLEAIAHHARQLMDAEGCTVFRLDTQSKTLRPLISLDPMSDRMMAIHIPVGTDITGRVVQSKQGEIANKASSSSQANKQENVLAVPLQVSDHIIGAMTVHRHTREFVSHDLELLTMFASQAAVAIENAELYQQLKERAESLQIAYRNLEEADKIKDEMIQNISHELRTPLTFVIGYLGLVVDGDLGPLTQQQQDSLKLVYNKAQALTRMVNDIITLQTIRIARPELQPVDIVALAQQALNVIQPTAKRAHINLIEDQLPSKPIRVSGEPARITQVFDNLFGNAIKFSPNGGSITVHIIEERPDQVRVEIQDTGIGIPPDKLEKVFERFYQVDGTATRRFGGVGMGLSICREIIKALGGHIWAESPTSGDHGSTFCFTLQKASDEQLYDNSDPA